MPDELIPKDVLDDLTKSGFTFDDDGKIKEDKFIEDEDDDQNDEDQDDLDDEDDQDEDDQDDDSSDDDEDEDQDDQDDDQDDNDEDDDEDDEDDDDDDDDEDETLLNLTPVKSKSDDDESSEIQSLKDAQQEVLKKLRELNTKSTDDDDEEVDGAEELKAEALKFKQMRLRIFAKEIERDVDAMSLGATFKDIIASSEWQDYLKSKAYGATIGTLYVDSIKENDGDAVVSFFKDFTERFIPSLNKTKTVSKTAKKVVKKKTAKKAKPNLDDLSVPEKSKTSKTPKKRVKFDYEENDYGVMLDKAERGRITYEEFVDFEDKFNAALKKGRVKKSS